MMQKCAKYLLNVKHVLIFSKHVLISPIYSLNHNSHVMLLSTQVHVY